MSVYTDAYLSGMKKQYNFRFDQENVETNWQKVAEMENRSLTNLIETVMNAYTASKLPTKEAKRSVGKKK